MGLKEKTIGFSIKSIPAMLQQPALPARLLLFREPIGQFSLFPHGRQFSLGAFGIA